MIRSGKMRHYWLICSLAYRSHRDILATMRVFRFEQTTGVGCSMWNISGVPCIGKRECGTYYVATFRAFNMVQV